VQKVLKELSFPREVNLLFLSIFLFAIANGINMVTFPALLNKNNVESSHIGFAFTFDIAGNIIMSFLLSRIVAKLTIGKGFKIASFSYASIILISYFYQNLFLWIFLVFLMGNLWFMQVITRQSWLNILVNNERRGIAIGILSTAVSIGIALGPLIVKILGSSNYFSFVTSAIFVIGSYFCLKPLFNNSEPKITSERISFLQFFRNNPRAFLARFFVDFQIYLCFSFTVIFGIGIGLKSEIAGLLISAYMTSAFFDLWVGFALKKWDPYKLINCGFLGSLICFIGIIFFKQYYIFLLISYFFFGITIAMIYVSVFKVINEDYSKEKLVAANATFQLIGSCGALSGTLLCGFLVKIFNASGFPITIILGCVCYLSFLVFYEKKISKNKQLSY